MDELLDNVMWHTLTGPHAHWAVGGGGARRYARGFSALVGFEDPAHPDWDGLAPFCAPGEAFYVGGWAGVVPAGWRIDAEARMFLMVWDGTPPDADDAPDAVPLTAAHADRALALAERMKPGPFGPRTLELGEYFGFVDADGRLLAMAGERMAAGRWREISGVATEPDQHGRGHARRLMQKLIRRQLARGETPFLHVMTHNAVAHELYLRMGFRDRHQSVVRVVARSEGAQP